MRKLLALTVLVSALGGAVGTSTAATHRSRYATARRAVCHYFPGQLCHQAMAVVRCETGGTYDPWATNGQYVNIFQMGTHERQTYGWHVAGSSVWKAAKAARAYYNDEVSRGIYGWHPWACQP